MKQALWTKVVASNTGKTRFRIKPENMEAYGKYMSRFNLGVDDCPVFEGMYDFCRLYTGASVEAARKLMSGYTDIAINYSGGLHHAKKWEASGFCYVNDIVVAILQLLRWGSVVGSLLPKRPSGLTP